MKTIWIVDGSYLLKSAHKFTPERFDYIKLKNELQALNGGPFFESYYLDSTFDPPTDAQNAFHTFLKYAPPHGPKMRVQLYKLKTMDVECPQDGHRFTRTIQKGVDVGIATLIIKLAVQGLYDRLVLSAGDGDFEDAIDYVKSELHKEVVICGFKDTVSADLQSYANEVVWLDDLWQQIKKQPHR